MQDRHVHQRTFGKGIAPWVGLFGGLAGILLLVLIADAKTSTTKAPSPPPASVAKAPICDMMSHPKIAKVAPDPVKPGDKVTIQGKNFGTRECFQGVSFGTMKADQFKYISETTLEATVPKVKPGLVQVNIQTAAGASQYVLLVKGK